MKKIIIALLLLFVATGCARFSPPIAPAIDSTSPAAVRIYVIRNRGTFLGEKGTDPWVVGIDDNALCRLKAGEYAVLNTTAGEVHFVVAKHLLGWWHERKEPFVAEPTTDYYYLTGVQDNSMFLEQIDATEAAAYITDAAPVCRPPEPVHPVVAAPAQPPPPPEEKHVVKAPSKPKPVVQKPKPKPTGALVQEIYFDLNKSTIKPGMYDDLDAVVQYLKQYPAAVIMLGGHASEEGTAKYNLSLSKRRADAVRAYLVKAGIKADRIREKAFGKADPKYDSSTAAGRRHNRRVDFKLVDGS